MTTCIFSKTERLEKAILLLEDTYQIREIFLVLNLNQSHLIQYAQGNKYIGHV